MIAVIDVGSNSVRLMLWADGKTILKRILTTRLAAGKKEGALNFSSMQRTAEAISALYAEAQKAGAEQVFAFATAAVRGAKNRDEFLSLVKGACPLSLDVVSGEEEASLAALGALGGADGVVLDVGGASSEAVCVKNGKKVFAESYPVGAVTLRESSLDRAELAKKRVKEVFASLPRLSGKVYAVGGTATALACLFLELREYDAARVQDFRLTKKLLNETADRLFSMPEKERETLAGMEKGRADVIACGACILAEMADKIGAEEIFASDRDNLEGYLLAQGVI